MQIAVDGATFDVLDEGSGPPIVLLHGIALAKEVWDVPASLLAHGARVVRPDLRGLGRSSVPPGPYLTESLAGDIAAVLDALRIQRAVIVAHSTASAVAFAFYRMFSERVAALGFVCGWADADDARLAQFRFAVAAAVERGGVRPVLDLYLPRCIAPHVARDRPHLVQRALALGLLSDPRGVAAAIRGFAMRVPPDDLFGEIDVPVRVMAGADDAFIPLQRQQTLAARVDGAVLDVLACGHFAPLEAPTSVAKSIAHLVLAAAGSVA